MNPRSLIQQCFTCQYYYYFCLLCCCYVLFQCVYCMFSAMAVLSPTPHPQTRCLFSHRELLYLCVLFFIFLYGYLLHYVVYNTVVCINTIIYFSMDKKNKGEQLEAWKIRLRHTEVWFLNPASLNIGTCDLSASILMLV